MFAAELISYQHTGAFSKLVLDYVAGSEQLQPFYAAAPTLESIPSLIKAKQAKPIDRTTLVAVLTEQYQNLAPSASVANNIRLLASESTFTVCTAHQPNLLTGPLYFIFKILHAVKLANTLKEEYPQYHFVPVYYMGCEDADLEELNHFTVSGKKYVWQTKQKGAVGRMKVDTFLIDLITELEGQIGVEQHGQSLIQLFKSAYTTGALIQDATAAVVHHLFQEYGLVILNPDNNRLKQLSASLFEEELFTQTSAPVVADTSQKLNKHYKVQAHPREINLFYLKDDIRQRIIKKQDKFLVNETDIQFTEESLREELRLYPERFSPNVILRGVFQEMILPNVAFVGGGGELAYWLQLKELFEHYAVPFPMLVLRNSFLIIGKKEQVNIERLKLSTPQLFASEIEILNKIIDDKEASPQLNGTLAELNDLYGQIAVEAKKADKTLVTHVEALKTRALKQLAVLEKKMYRAERKKHTDAQQQIQRLREQLFPNGGLQERVENFSFYYAQWGAAFLENLLRHSPGLEQTFTVLKTSK